MKLYIYQQTSHKSYKITNIPISLNHTTRFLYKPDIRNLDFFGNQKRQHDTMYRNGIIYKNGDKEDFELHEVIDKILDDNLEKTFTYCFVENKENNGTAMLILTETGRYINGDYKGAQTIRNENKDEFNEIDEVSKHKYLCAGSRNIICAGILKFSKDTEYEKYNMIIDLMSGTFKPTEDNLNIVLESIYNLDKSDRVNIEPIYNVNKNKNNITPINPIDNYCNKLDESIDHHKMCPSAGGKKLTKRKKNTKNTRKRRSVKRTKRLKKRRKTKRKY